MNEKEISEIRRRFRTDKNNITHIHGCYVNEKQEAVSTFSQSLALMPEEERESLLGVLRRTLSGTLGQNLIDMPFSTAQVLDSEEHRLLMSLRDSRLEDDTLLTALFERVAAAYRPEGTYLILVASDTYDIPYRGRDGETMEDASSEVFRYILCAVCPVKQTKPALTYFVPESAFHNSDPDWLVSPPALGFLFPAFTDRSADIYSALYYTRDTAESCPDFAVSIFGSEPPMPAAEQKETFGTILGDALGETCSFDVVQTLHTELCERIETHKVNKETEPLRLSRGDVTAMLTACGVDDRHVTEFSERYDSAFGSEADLPPKNLVETRRMTVETPDITIHVSPEKSGLIETRMLDGRRCIVIHAEDGVSVNGVPVRITEE